MVGFTNKVNLSQGIVDTSPNDASLRKADASVSPYPPRPAVGSGCIILRTGLVMAVGLFLDTWSWSYCGLRWDRHRKLLEAQGKEDKSFCFSVLLLCSLPILPIFQIIWEELLSWEQGRTEEGE